jgi:hypothetical protein
VVVAEGRPSCVFLLSPANCSGTRAKQALSPRARFALADALRSPTGAPLGDVFAFISGLYFRGKLAYACRFANPPEPGDAGDFDCSNNSDNFNSIRGRGVLVITPNAGLRSPDTRVTHAAVRAFASHDIDASNETYRRPLEAGAKALLADIGDDCNVVLLGSIASPKYVDVLIGIFGDRLLFPAEFVGRGDMSRGGLLLRHAEAGVELAYAAVAGATLHGKRPPRLAPLPRRRTGPPSATSAVGPSSGPISPVLRRRV